MRKRPLQQEPAVRALGLLLPVMVIAGAIAALIANFRIAVH
jgi:hypothetical protein